MYLYSGQKIKHYFYGKDPIFTTLYMKSIRPRQDATNRAAFFVERY
jgi:hypothetical protein